jgi:hypothetical protein
MAASDVAQIMRSYRGC